MGSGRQLRPNAKRENAETDDLDQKSINAAFGRPLPSMIDPAPDVTARTHMNVYLDMYIYICIFGYMYKSVYRYVYKHAYSIEKKGYAI